MSAVNRFIKRLDEMGLSLKRTGPDAFVLVGPAENKTAEVIAACKAFKPLLRDIYPWGDETYPWDADPPLSAPEPTAKP